MRHARDGGARQGLGLLGGLRAVGVHPRVVLADVDHVEEERVQSAGLGGAPEGVLVQQRRAGGNDDAVELELADVLLNQLLARVRAHVLVVARKDHARQFLDIFRDLGAVHHRRDVMAAVADVETMRISPLACCFIIRFKTSLFGLHWLRASAGAAFSGRRGHSNRRRFGRSPLERNGGPVQTQLLLGKAEG